MIKEYFESFLQKIDIESKTHSEIIDIGKEITYYVDQYFCCNIAQKESQFIGSFGRNTAVYTENIRIMVAIPVKLYMKIGMNADEILGNLKNALIPRFKTCEFSDNGNGLNINMGNDLSFEIVPGFMIGEGVYIYLSNKKWKQLNLKIERDSLEKLNSENNNALINLCKMMKVWKNILKPIDNAKVVESNILLDTLVYYYFKQLNSKLYLLDNYDKMIYDFFNFLLSVSNLKEFISIDGKTILKRKGNLYDCVFYSLAEINTALSCAEIGEFQSSINTWQHIFGSDFSL